MYIHVAGVAILAKKQKIAKIDLLNDLVPQILVILANIYLLLKSKDLKPILNGFHSFYFTHMAFSYMYVLTSYIGVASFYFNITSSHVIGYLMHMSLFL